jgi:Xaa-Pro aminopeptidase
VFFVLLVAGTLVHGASPQAAGDFPRVLSVRERVATVNHIVEARLDQLLPQAMRETGFDMWIIVTNEDNYEPVFQTLIPYNTWAPITQILVFYDPGAGKPIERLNVSRTNLRGLYKDAWDARAWDTEKKESQWDALARVVRERDPKVIGINEGDVQWAAGGLTVPLKKALLAAIGPTFAPRLRSAEPLVTRWLETLLDEEIEVFSQVVAVAHALAAETMSNAVITPGTTTVDDMIYHYWQRAANLGLDLSFLPGCSIRGRSPADAQRWGPADRTVRHGDVLHCDVGIKYLRYNTDHQELAYVLRVGESDAPESLKKALAEANRLQDAYASQFKAGLTGDQLLTNILSTARAQGIPNPRVYSHSLGYFLHEPGPLIGLPWEQVSNPGRGDVKLVDNSCFTAELSVDAPIPEWGDKVFRVPLEQDVCFTKGRLHFIDGRQTSYHLVGRGDSKRPPAPTSTATR